MSESPTDCHWLDDSDSSPAAPAPPAEPLYLGALGISQQQPRCGGSPGKPRCDARCEAGSPRPVCPGCTDCTDAPAEQPVDAAGDVHGRDGADHTAGVRSMVHAQRDAAGDVAPATDALISALRHVLADPEMVGAHYPAETVACLIARIEQEQRERKTLATVLVGKCDELQAERTARKAADVREAAALVVRWKAIERAEAAEARADLLQAKVDKAEQVRDEHHAAWIRKDAELQQLQARGDALAAAAGDLHQHLLAAAPYSLHDPEMEATRAALTDWRAE